MYLAINALLANPPRNKLRVLRAKIENENEFVMQRTERSSVNKGPIITRCVRLPPQTEKRILCRLALDRRCDHLLKDVQVDIAEAVNVKTAFAGLVFAKT